MKNLKNLREIRGYTQKEFASLCNLSPQTYSNYETGKRQPDFATLKTFAKKLNTTSDYLLELIDNYEPLSKNEKVSAENYISRNNENSSEKEVKESNESNGKFIKTNLLIKQSEKVYIECGKNYKQTYTEYNVTINEKEHKFKVYFSAQNYNKQNYDLIDIILESNENTCLEILKTKDKILYQISCETKEGYKLFCPIIPDDKVILIIVLNILGYNKKIE